MLTKRKKQILIKESQTHEKDSGSAEVQVSLLSKEVDVLVSHLKKHPKDNSSRRGLLTMIAKRRKLMGYLKIKKPKQYEKLAKKLKI
ncbi:MAG: 30S ribosomal protein S15 [bacterium]|nr:30S ribosomal protein S15 [bacterium]